MNIHLVIMFCMIAAGIGWGLGLYSSGWNQRSVTGSNQRAAERPPRPGPRVALRHDVEEVSRAMGTPDSDKIHLARKWAGSDPDQFLSWLLRTKPPPAEELVTAFFTEWARTNPEAAFEFALNLPDPFEAADPGMLLARMMSAILNEDWKTGLAWLEKAQDAGATPLRMTKDFLWLQDPTLEMGEALAQLEPGALSNNLLLQFAIAYTRQDFGAARRWALCLPPEQSAWAMAPVLSTWASRDLKGALTYLETSASSGIRQNLGEVVLQDFAMRDAKAALEWTEVHMPVPGAIRQILSTWADRDLESVTELVVNLEDPQQREAYLEALADDRRRRNTQHFLDWVQPLSTGNRAVALNTVAKEITTWTPKPERQLFLDYVAELPVEEISDSLIREMGGGLARRDPLESLLWAASLPRDRADRAIEAMVTAWIDMNREHAVRTIESMEAGPAREAALRVIAEQQ